VIRFSAALVAVAIGVLIGGIATGKLLLVYIAIVVSAVALVALAIGVMLKREELFGEGQGLVPAAAGAGPVPLVRVGESQAKVSPSAQVAPPPERTDLSAARPAEAGQGRVADPVPPWATPAARDPRSSPALDPRPAWMMPAGQDTSAGRASSGQADGWDVPDGDAQAATTAARSWAAPSSSTVSTDAPPAKPSAGSGSTPPPSWFDRLGKSVLADAPASTSTPAPGAESGWSWSSQDSTAPAPAGATASDSGGEDDDPKSGASLAVHGGVSRSDRASLTSDREPRSGEMREAQGAGSNPSGADEVRPSLGEAEDGALSRESPSFRAGRVQWPTRYSWLDDETDEGGEADEANAEPGSKSPASADTSSDIGSAAAPQDTAAPRASAPADAGPSEHAATAEHVAVAAVPDPGPERDVVGEAEAESDAEVTGEAASEPPAEGPADAAPEAGLVAVVKGVPRYHAPDCVLIRFMPEGDAQRQSIPEAREAGCTPCSVCQPDG
jgi:hypothetical protein